MLCIGHRGAMGYEPENTASSIRKALELQAACVEIDVHCVEGKLIVFHDHRLDRTTNGTGYVAEQSFNYIRSLDAGKGQQIPTLEEVCRLVRGRAGLNIELKGPGTTEPTADFIADLFAQGWSINSILVSSFDHRKLKKIKQLDSRILTGALICCLPENDAEIAESLGAFSIHPAVEFVDKRLVDDAHKRGLRTYVYTVNSQEDLQIMRDLEVDGIFTNYPDLLRPGLERGQTAACWI